MTARRIRNGIDLDALEARLGSAGEPSGLDVRTEWLGGAQSVATICRGTASAASSFTIHVDDGASTPGTGQAPAPCELAAVALSAAFAQAFIVAASRDDVAVDALSVRIAQTTPSARAAGPQLPRWDIHCNVESDASLRRLRSYAIAASTSGVVTRLSMAIAKVSVSRGGRGRERDMT